MTTGRSGGYRTTFRTLVLSILAVSVLPLLVIATANFILFSFLNHSIVVDGHSSLLRYHKETIETFLSDVTAEVATLAHEYTLGELKGGDLERIFAVIQRQGSVYTDVGIIDSRGDHVKYVGPYDLAGRNYRETEWFARVVEKGVYVSDVFLGFRGVPHFVVAVMRREGGDFWILRATVNTDTFSKLVDAARMGRTGETLIVNREGLNQTKTRFAGKLLEPTGYPDLVPHDGIRVRQLDVGGTRYLYATTWLTEPRWLLISRQEVADAYAPLRRAAAVGVLMCAAGVMGAGVLAVVVARAQVRRIVRADKENEALTQRLVATGKTAAVGEMSTGLAHEINNPLATIDTLQTWIGDLAGITPIAEEDRAEILDSAAKIGEQVERCKEITQGLLKFARRVESKPEEVQLNEVLRELATILRARARVEGVELATDLAPLPVVLASITHLQQVFVNLVNNAVDAVAGKTDGRVEIRSRLSDGRVRVEVADNGAGIPEDHMSSIFLPFFTTKPVGQGTGLGLAICHGLVRDLGGQIEVSSTVGVGSTFTVLLPLAPLGPQHLEGVS